MENICNKFNSAADRVVKAKCGHTQEFTFSDVVSRILLDTFSPIDKMFPEIRSRSTIGVMLNKCFPGKQIRSQNWYSYVLLSINKKKCTKCFNILDTCMFYGDSASMCKLCEKSKYEIYYINNKEKVNLRNREYNIANNDAAREQKREYYQGHKAESKARNIQRTLSIKSATPSWANMSKMNKIYGSRNYDEHVDHIIPIQGELVCGLHCEHNLQYLSISENISKSNKFNIDDHIHELPYF